MNLARHLKTCTWHHLWAVAHGRSLAVPRNPTKTQLRSLLLDDLSDLEALAAELSQLPPQALAVLHLLALQYGWLPARDLAPRFGELRPFKPWAGRPPGESPPWRDPISPIELLCYRGLIYPQDGIAGPLDLRTAGLGLPDELVPLLPPAPSPARPRSPRGPGTPATALLHDLVLFHAHLAGHAFHPRQGRWLTPAQFRPLLDRLWPPGCPLLAADRRCQGEKSTHFLRTLHFVAEAAGFVPSPDPPPRHLHAPPPPQDQIESMAPGPFHETLIVTDDPDYLPAPGQTVHYVAGPRSRTSTAKEPPPPPPPGTLLPTLLWHHWLAQPPFEQLLHLAPIVTGADPDLAPRWRAFELPGWQAAGRHGADDPLLPLRRLCRTLRHCPADGTWLDLEAFLDSLPWHHAALLPGQTQAPDDPHRRLLSGFLAWLGLVQLDRWQEPAAFRLTPLGASLLGVPGAPPWQPVAHPLRLADPAGDALPLAVDPGCAPALLYHLATHPRLEWTGPGTARLTPASLAGASRRELSELLRLLHRGLPRPLPGDAARHLWDWAGQGSSLAIRRVTLLETDDAELLAFLAGKRGIRSHLRRAHGRRAVELESNTLESLLRKLHRLGLAPDVQVELSPYERPRTGRPWGPEDAGHLLLAARLYNRLPGRAPLGQSGPLFRPTHYIPESTLRRLADGLSPRLLETVDQMVEDTLRRLNDAIDGWRSPPLLPDQQLSGHALDGVLDLIRQALARDLPLELEYYTAGRGDLTHRTVEPLRLEDRDGVAYLVAYCRLRRAERIFRVDRIRTAQLTS